MSYVVHNFHSGDIIYADDVNEIDAQVAANDEAISHKISEPVTEGSNGQVLGTDGAGTRTWVTVASADDVGDITELQTEDKSNLVHAINELKNKEDDLTDDIAEVKEEADDNKDAIGDLSALETTVKDNLVNAINEVKAEADDNKDNIGNMSALETTDKSSLVAAINELKDVNDNQDDRLDDIEDNVGTLASLTTDDKTNLVAAINEVDANTDANTDAIGNLADLATTAKDNLVNAVNETFELVDNKMDKENPTGTGAFSLNRRAGTAVGVNSTAEGTNCAATGENSHAEGEATTASGKGSHAEGKQTSVTFVSANYAHVEGVGSVVSAQGAHAEGYFTNATKQYQHVSGKYNVADTTVEHAVIVGNGTGGSDRSNAYALDWDGNAHYAGNVFAGDAAEGDVLARENIIANEYNETATYAVGDYVMHENKMFKCIEAIETAEAWNADHWTQKLVSEEFGTGGGGGADIDDDVIATDKTWSSHKINDEITTKKITIASSQIISTDPTIVQMTDEQREILDAAHNEILIDGADIGYPDHVIAHLVFKNDDYYEYGFTSQEMMADFTSASFVYTADDGHAVINFITLPTIDDETVYSSCTWSSWKISAEIGDLDDLQTTDKSNLVSAVNEVKELTDGIGEDIGDIADLDTTDKSNVVAAVNEVVGDIGNLSTLTTDAKTSAVSAINEVDAKNDQQDEHIENLENDTSTLFESIGVLATLDTDAKDNLVHAINEVNAHADQNATNITTLEAEVYTKATKGEIVDADIAAGANINMNKIGGLTEALESKQPTLTSGTTIKTINGTSVLGAGNINTTEIDDTSDSNVKTFSTHALNTRLGDNANLTTAAKTNLVAAINEINTSASTFETRLLAVETLADETSTDLGDISALTTTVKTNTVAAINEVDGDVGNITDLTTTANDNLVEAVNELDAEISDLSGLTTDAKDTLVNAINEVDMHADRLWADIAKEYNPASTYSIADYVLYDWKLYKCSTNITTPETFNPAHWNVVRVMGEITGGGGSIGFANVIAPDYDETKAYGIGEYVVFDNKFYKAKQNIFIPEYWNEDHWQRMNVSDALISSSVEIDDTIITTTKVWSSKKTSDTIGELTGLDTTDKSSAVAGINEVNGNVGQPASLTTTAKTNVVAGVNEVNANVGNLSTLTTTTKGSAVAAINELDSDVGDKSTLTTIAKSNTVAAINELDADIGNLTTLTTTAKSSAVAAINELDDEMGDLDDLTTADKDTIVEAVNELDSDIGNVASLTTTVKTNTVAAINEVNANIGNLTDLDTTDKTSAVLAINEVSGRIGDLSRLSTDDKSNLVNAINEVYEISNDAAEDIDEITTNLGDLATLTTTTKTSAVAAINEVNASVLTNAENIAALEDKVGDLSTLTTSVKASAVAAINEVDGDIGDKASLTTLAKDNLVNAINEHDAEIGNLSNLTTDNKDTLVEAINEVDLHADQINDDVAEEYSDSKTYDKNSYCRHDGDLYRSTTAIMDAEAWNNSHWTKVTIGSELFSHKLDIGDVSNLDTATKANLVYAINETFNQNIALDKLVATTTTPTIPQALLPEFVDAILEYDSIVDFPATGQPGRIYVDKATNKAYRWSGTQYSEISPTIALGTTSDTAFRGDKGLEAYTHSVTKKGSEFGIGFYKIATNDEGHVISAVPVEASDIPNIPATKITTGTIQFERLPVGDSATEICRGDIGNVAYTHAVTKKGSAFDEGFYKITTNDQGHVTAASEVIASDIPNLPASKITSGTLNIARIPVGTTSGTVFAGDLGEAAYEHAVTNKGEEFTSGFYKFATNEEGHVTDATAVQTSDILNLIFDSLYPVGAIYTSTTATVIPPVFSGTWVEVKPVLNGNTWDTLETDGTEIIISYVPGTAAGNVHYWKRTA